MPRSLAVVLLAAAYALPGTAPGHGQKADGPKPALKARIEARPHEAAFSVLFYLKNEGDKDVEVVYGRGGAGMEVVPRLYVGEFQVTPPTYLRPPSRSLRPNKLRVPASKEILYGTFTMGYPPAGRKGKDVSVTAYISFNEPRLDLKTPAQRLTIPAAPPR